VAFFEFFEFFKFFEFFECDILTFICKTFDSVWEVFEKRSIEVWIEITVSQVKNTNSVAKVKVSNSVDRWLTLPPLGRFSNTSQSKA